MILLSLFALLLSYTNVRARQDFNAAAIPLAVRSPYLNCWLQTGAPPVFGATWPTSFNLSQILGWSVLVRIDGLTYSFLGDVVQTLHNGTVNSTSIVVTPTQTVVTAQAGPMQVNLTFLNPIEPQDWVKHSIPFSYLAFTATSTDGAAHTVQVYSDVSGEWNSGDRTQKILWSKTFNADVVFHSVSLQTQVKFTEVIDQAEWGTLYYAMQAGDSVTVQIASDNDSRGNFTHNGVLSGHQDPVIRPVSDNLAVFAISRDLGTIKTTQAPVVWAIGYTTDDAVNYNDLFGAPPASRSPYYKLRYSNDEELIIDFLKDFSSASSRARDLDNKILQLADSVSNNLGDLVSASIAQVYGSMQLTVGTDTRGNPNSDMMMFMKNIGGVQKNRVNAVETLYAAFPALMSITASFGALLLEPLFRLQASSNYTIPYAAPDLGSNYPNVSGSISNHSQGVEQTANMLIMTYAYARASGDGNLINKYYKLLTTWTDYLNDTALFHRNQSSADNLSVSNQTNLAIKGIIAIEAMSKMSGIAKNAEDMNKYSTAAARLYAQWKSLALGSDQHVLAVYGQSNSWTLGYNLFADLWLGTNLVESIIYDGHCNFLHNLVLTSNFSTFGMPVDSLNTDVAVSSWSLFAARMTSNQGLCSDLITKVFDRANNRTIPEVFPVNYESGNGTSPQDMPSRAQGAVLAPLARQILPQTINDNSPPSSKKQKIAAIAGGIGVAVAIFAVIGVARFGDLERQMADAVQEAERDHQFSEKQPEQDRQFEESEARRDATLTRQPVPHGSTPLPEVMLGLLSEGAESVFASIRSASTESAARHADDIRFIVQGEREEMAKQLQAEREEAHTAREEARAAREALEQQVVADRTRVDEERDTCIRELEEELTRVRAELSHKNQQRDHDEELRREAESQRNLERDEEARRQLIEITDLLLSHREEFARKKETVDERWREKLEWRDETNRQFQDLFGMVQYIVDGHAEEKERCEEERRAAAERPSTQDLMDELFGQRQVFDSLTTSWREETERQHAEIVQSMANVQAFQVPLNVQGDPDEYGKSLVTEVRMLQDQVSKLQEERRSIQSEIGTLLSLRSKFEASGIFDPEWKPTSKDHPAPQPPSDLPPDRPPVPPPEPRQGALNSGHLAPKAPPPPRGLFERRRRSTRTSPRD